MGAGCIRTHSHPLARSSRRPCWTRGWHGGGSHLLADVRVQSCPPWLEPKARVMRLCQESPGASPHGQSWLCSSPSGLGQGSLLKALRWPAEALTGDHVCQEGIEGSSLPPIAPAWGWLPDLASRPLHHEPHGFPVPVTRVTMSLHSKHSRWVLFTWLGPGCVLLHICISAIKGVLITTLPPVPRPRLPAWTLLIPLPRRPHG